MPLLFQDLRDFADKTVNTGGSLSIHVLQSTYVHTPGHVHIDVHLDTAVTGTLDILTMAFTLAHIDADEH